MITNEQLKVEGLKALTAALGDVQAEKFIALMRASSNWTIFMRNLDRAFPKSEQQLELLLED